MSNLNNEFMDIISPEYDNYDDYNSHDETEQYRYKDSTYDLISKVAFLIGVPKRVFENESQPPKISIYKMLDQNKHARIIRNLCIVRTSIERGFKAINNEMRFNNKSIFNLPNCIPPEATKKLEEDGINFIKKSSTKLVHHIIEINKLINDRINNCKNLFPLWIEWLYIRELFIMPNGLSENGTKAAAELYYNNLNYYPYKIYINWNPQPLGNILYNDKKFASLLYDWHGLEFAEFSKVSDAGSFVKNNIYDFIEESDKISVVVDCENSDPYKLYATLRNLDHEYLKKISSIMLFDDKNSASTWRIFEDTFTQIPVNHIMTERVKSDKSVLDAVLITCTCREHYENHVDSFLLVSSDSDYFGLISNLKSARFLVLLERDSCSPDLKKSLASAEVFFAYIDDFYSGNAEDIKYNALFNEMYRYIDNTVRLNVNEMFNEALRATRVEMTTAERNQFFAKHIKNMQLRINDNGDVILELKPYR